jgi:integrase
VVLDKRTKTWNFFYWENGKRRSKKIGTLSQFPTKASAWREAKPLRDAVESRVSVGNVAPKVKMLVEQYRAEKMPKRSDTRRSYEVWIRNRILPNWGECELLDVQARPVELWLEALTLAPKSKVHIRGMLSILWDFAMWRGDIPTQRNPMELVTIKGATKRTRKPRSLTVEEFQKFTQHLGEPFRTMALLCVCFGLRVSEALALKWSDIDWLDSKLRVERGIVGQIVDDVKTRESESQPPVDEAVLAVLKNWKQLSQFSGPEDWMFASPAQLGRLPWSYESVWRAYQKAAAKARIGRLGTHTMRHMSGMA